MKPIFLLAFLWSITGWTIIGFEDAAFPELSSSSRALGMGNAYISKVDDSASSFYNPAGLGTVRFANFHLSNLHLEVNKNWFGLSTAGAATDFFGKFDKTLELDGQRQLLLDDKGKLISTHIQVMPNFTMRYFSVGYLYTMKTRATIGKEDGALFEYAKRIDHGPYASMNLSMFGGILKFGITGILLSRDEAIGEVNPNQAFELKSSDYKSGEQLISVAGLRLTLPVAPLPTLALTIHNPFEKKFSSSKGAGLPDPIKRQIDLGLSITPYIGKTIRTHWEINYKDMTGEHDIDIKRRILLGFELDFFRIIYFRLGYGDGFGSGGLGIKTQKIQFDFTTYAIDTTSSEFRGTEDRRFVLGLSTGF